MNMLDALADRALFGSLPAFADLSTWRPWLAFLRAFYGLPMDDEDLELFRRHTGREAPREGGYPEAAVVVGRQSGKTRFAALVGIYEAARAVMAGERGLYVPLVAQDLRAAQRALFGYVRELVTGSELLAREVTRETTTELELAARVTLAVYPCRPAAVRGIRAACAVVDELAYFTATDGRPTDAETLRAARPTLATTGGRLLILSSVPTLQAGALYDLHRRHFGREDSSVLVWQATAPAMNPTLPADYLSRMEADDPEAYRSEVLGRVPRGRSELPRSGRPGRRGGVGRAGAGSGAGQVLPRVRRRGERQREGQFHPGRSAPGRRARQCSIASGPGGRPSIRPA